MYLNLGAIAYLVVFRFRFRFLGVAIFFGLFVSDGLSINFVLRKILIKK